MARYIDANRLINEISGNGGVFTYGHSVVKAIVSRINIQPTADVVEVKHGEWLTKEYQYGKDDESDDWVEKPAEQGDCAYCSLCLQNAGLNGSEEYVLSDYCPHCGAKMDGKSLKEV